MLNFLLLLGKKKKPREEILAEKNKTLISQVTVQEKTAKALISKTELKS